MTNHVSNYSEEELLDAIRQQMCSDKKFKGKVEKAVQTKDSQWLQQLIVQVARVVFGVVVSKVIDLVKEYFLNKD